MTFDCFNRKQFSTFDCFNLCIFPFKLDIIDIFIFFIITYIINFLNNSKIKNKVRIR